MRATCAERGNGRWRSEGRRVPRAERIRLINFNSGTIVEMRQSPDHVVPTNDSHRSRLDEANGEMASVFVANVPCFCTGGTRRSPCNGRAISRSLFNVHLGNDRAAWAALTPEQRASPAWSHLSRARGERPTKGSISWQDRVSVDGAGCGALSPTRHFFDLGGSSVTRAPYERWTACSRCRSIASSSALPQDAQPWSRSRSRSRSRSSSVPPGRRLGLEIR